MCSRFLGFVRSCVFTVCVCVCDCVCVWLCVCVCFLSGRRTDGLESVCPESGSGRCSSRPQHQRWYGECAALKPHLTCRFEVSHLTGFSGPLKLHYPAEVLQKYPRKQHYICNQATYSSYEVKSTVTSVLKCLNATLQSISGLSALI